MTIAFVVFNGILAAGIVAGFSGLVTTTYRALSAERRSETLTSSQVREAVRRAA